MESGKNLKVLFVSAEVSPFAKTGGLADVAGSLPQTLCAMGNDVRVVMPRYKGINCSMKYITDFPVQTGNRKETCIIRETEVDAKAENKSKKVPVYFIDSYHYFDRDGIYCHYDDGERFAFLCMAVLEMLPRINFQPDIIHCNDWHTGPICMLLKEKYKSESFYSGIATIYTIHNLEYQGHFSRDILGFMNLNDELFVPEKVEFYGSFNFMKAGLVYTDVINTVSKEYAKEIQTPQYGERLDGLLKSRQSDLYGIVNGISYDEFNPSTDTRIYKNYDQESYTLKKENKLGLQKEMGLPCRDVPVIGLISRLAGQKGLDLILKEIDHILKNDIQFVLLGTGDPYFENGFRNIRDKYPDKVAIYLGFNAALAQRIYAGSDMFLMPSRFEPCGLGQIISFRYGTIPIVRATGGLAETVTDVGAESEEGNGFSFKEYSSQEMLKTINRAIKLYTEYPYRWNALVQKALALDYSWKHPAENYMQLYYKAIERNR